MEERFGYVDNVSPSHRTFTGLGTKGTSYRVLIMTYERLNKGGDKY